VNTQRVRPGVILLRNSKVTAPRAPGTRFTGGNYGGRIVNEW
jgi:hypothetical protein